MKVCFEVGRCFSQECNITRNCLSLVCANSKLAWQVSNCLGYEDRIEDGFYEVWGMSPYVWSMCTDSNELGRMPPMESLRSVSPTEAAFEVVLVDRNSDPDLKDLEERVVGLAYESEEVSDLAKKLAQMVANVMGGAAASDDELMEAWRVSTDKLTQRLQSIVLPIGMLRTGLSRHRALLFKVWLFSPAIYLIHFENLLLVYEVRSCAFSQTIPSFNVLG